MKNESKTPELICRIKTTGIKNDAVKTLNKMKEQCIRIVDLMDDDLSLTDDDRDNLATILGGLVVQSEVIEMAINDNALTPNHARLIEYAMKTVKDIDSIIEYT